MSSSDDSLPPFTHADAPVAATAVSATLQSRDIVSAALLRRAEDQSGVGTLEIKPETLAEAERKCADKCTVIQTLVQDPALEPCLMLSEEKLLQNADCKKAYCGALVKVVSCARCQYSTFPIATDTGALDAEAANLQKLYCEGTGVDVTKA